MLAKLRLESGEFCFWKKLILQGLLSVMAAYVHLDSFRMDWPGASVGEFIVYSLTQENYFLVLFPFLCLAWTGGKSQEVCRYPLLLRYRTRNEFFLIRFLAKAFFAMAVLLEHIGILFLIGLSLPIAPQRLFLSSGHPAGIILMQFLNLFCYVCVMILLYELLLHAAGNAILGVMLTVSVSLLNLLAVKLALKTVIMWTPWGNIAYRLFGRERPGYRFYGTYWIFLLLLLFFLADEWNGRKDYVFEETRKTE
ncbi:MAG: hypothetical protein NC432_09760 [Roseburia sp.]|nr:hypothetical protein [Roseburia sp.]MCM1096801.1 hypothetical protein [Ruminococcus flavefaciens]